MSSIFQPVPIPTPPGDPITVTVTGPSSVVQGQQFTYVIDVLDKDQVSPFNPSGTDPSTAVSFHIESMKQFAWNIAPNPNSQGALVCVITGVAQDTPGDYEDVFTGYNTRPGLAWDAPRNEVHVVTVTPAARPAAAN